MVFNMGLNYGPFYFELVKSYNHSLEGHGIFYFLPSSESEKIFCTPNMSTLALVLKFLLILKIFVF